jgi:oligoendopeptidase F
LSNYVSNNYRINVKDPHFTGLYQKISHVFSEIGQKLSDLNSIIIKNQQKISKLLKEKEFSYLTREYNNVFKYIPHTLSDELELTLSKLSILFESTEENFSKITDGDFVYKNAIDSKKKEHKVNSSSIFTLLESEDENLRKSA